MMAQVPPTPLLPLRMGLGEGWEGVEESLLMDQEPDFDDSIFDITFNIEHSRTEVGMDMPKKGESLQGVFQLEKSREERDEESEVGERSERLEGRGVSGTPRRIASQSITPRADTPQANYPQADTLLIESYLPGKRNEEDDLECEVARNISHRNEEELPDFGGTTETYNHDDHDLEEYVSEPSPPPLDESYHNQEPPYEPISPVRSVTSPPAREKEIPEETSFLGWGEQPTIADLQLELSLSLSPSLPRHSGSSSGSYKRAATSPRQASERKKVKPRSPGRDDYYSRRLSRQSSNGSFASPSIPSLYLASSSSCSFSQSQSTSRPREVSGGGPSRRTTSHVPVYPHLSDPGPGPEPAMNQDPNSGDNASPAPRPTLLARFLAKSTILHPSRSKLSESVNRPISPARSDRTSLESASRYSLNIPLDHDGVDMDPLSPVAQANDLSVSRRSSLLASDSTHDIGDTSIVSHGSEPTTSELGSSLRRSTSQRVLGFFSDLLRTSTPVKSPQAEPVAPEADDRSINLDLADGDLSVETEPDEDQKDQDISYSSHESRPSSSSARYPPLPAYNNIPGYRPLTRPNQVPISHTASRAANPIRQPKPKVTSTFTSSALARLPAPGKGASSAGERITVKPIERASNLQARRALFEVPSNVPSGGKGETKKTIPLNGKTPGKAARARAEERRLFDKGVRERLEAKRREREEEEKKRKEEEERIYKEARRGTVVRARPVPGMYRKKA